MTGDNQDITRLCKRAMNQAASRRLISKQEAIVHLGDLDLATCSETITNVSISNSRQLRKASSDKSSKNFLDKYKQRQKKYENFSLHEYFHELNNDGNSRKKNAKIPHFIGISGAPKFPVMPSMC